MKKKILTAILSGLLIATLAGCGNQLPENDAPNSMASADTAIKTDNHFFICFFMMNSFSIK